MKWILLLHCLIVYTVAIEDELIPHLLKNYSKQARPVTDPDIPVNASFSMEIIQVVKVGDRDQFLQVKVWVRQSWQNMFLTWNPAQWKNIKSVRIESEKLWVPDIVLYNNADSEFSGGTERYKTRVEVFHDGRCQWLAPTIFTSTCRINIRHFPFDQQKCIMKFGSWTYSAKGVSLTSDGNPLITSQYVNSTEWELHKATRKVNSVKYACCPDPFMDVTFYVILKRKPLYYLFNVILPCVILIATTLFGFFLPPESGERISLTITILLAVAVFLQLVSDTLPKNSDSIPMLALFYMIIMTLSALSLITTCAVLVIHYRSVEKGTPPMPKWVRVYVVDKLATFLCIRRKNIYDKRIRSESNGVYISGNDNESFHEIKEIVNKGNNLFASLKADINYNRDSVKNRKLSVITTAMLSELHKITESIRNQEENTKVQEDWRFVGKVLDRLFFWIFLVTVIISSCTILIPSYFEFH